VWVGIIALVGLAAQTGIVMLVYINHAYDRRRREGRIQTREDIVAAHMEGTVQRVRPKLMTVSTMLIGLVPLLWATTSGADVMKRIAAPMVGGLLTSAFLTLEIIPVVVTGWRTEQLLWEKLQLVDAGLRRQLALATLAIGLGLALLVLVPVSGIYLSLPTWAGRAGLAIGALLMAAGTLSYALRRPTARRLVWPSQALTPKET
jgi:Cu(I)/Ag(I) efflux system membrane protein CusA/SilA